MILLPAFVFVKQKWGTLVRAIPQINIFQTGATMTELKKKIKVIKNLLRGFL